MGNNSQWLHLFITYLKTEIHLYDVYYFSSYIIKVARHLHYKDGRLKLFRKIIGIYPENQKKHVITFVNKM
jgi:hypothetical protein